MNGSPRTLGDDDRALANNIALFFGTLIIGFLLWMVFEPAGTQMLDIAEAQTSRQSSAQGQAYVRFAFENLHLIVVGFGVVQLVAAAAYEASVTGGVPR